MTVENEIKEVTKDDVIKLLSSETYRTQTALLLCNNNRKQAAKLMNISQRTLFRIIKRNNIKS